MGTPDHFYAGNEAKIEGSVIYFQLKPLFRAILEGVDDFSTKIDWCMINTL